MNAEQRASEAQLVLSSPVYRESYVQIEANIVNQLAQQSLAAAEAEDLRKLLIALRKVKTYMEQVVTTGKMEALNQRTTLLDRMRRRA